MYAVPLNQGLSSIIVLVRNWVLGKWKKNSCVTLSFIDQALVNERGPHV